MDGTGPLSTTLRLIAVLACCLGSLHLSAAPAAAPAAVSVSAELSAADRAFLDELQSRAFLYFVDHTDLATGLTRDRAPADGGKSSAASSIAATGFALSAWCIAADRGWLPFDLARSQTRQTLHFLLDHAENVHGWFYHFLETETGRRAMNSEVSTIDTSLMLMGAVFAREYFRDPQITTLVNQLYHRLDWKWALNDGTALSHGWRPESGFIRYRWDHYAEMMGLYLLGIGAPSGPLPPSSWHAFERGPLSTYAGLPHFACPPLFTHQYSHAWFDFRGQRDAYANYFQNSVNATLAQRQWSADQSARFPRWSLDLWGLSASDSARGYVAWGAPTPPGSDGLDGTVVPCAPGGSLPFAPAECLASLRSMRAAGGDKAWQRYGFVDAFNPHNGWVASDVLGIDQGIMLLMAENLRTNLVWRFFMKAPEVQRAMKLAGFQPE